MAIEAPKLGKKPEPTRNQTWLQIASRIDPHHLVKPTGWLSVENRAFPMEEIDLIERRALEKRDDVYIVRLEQFYPWPIKSISEVLNRFTNAELVWCQEEPKNMGGWTFVDPWIELTLGKLEVRAKRARYVGRPASASTAAGQMKRHNAELEAFLTEAFAK